MSQQKVLVLVGDAAEELDAMYPIYRLREAGYVADVAALTRRDVQLVIVAAAEGARAAFAMNVVMQEEEGLGPDPPRRIAKPRSPDIRIRGNPGGDRR